MLDRIRSIWREAINRVFSKSTVQQMGLSVPVSDNMLNEIGKWTDLYMGNAPWLHKNRQSLSLPSAIASEIARMVTIEMAVSVNGSARAEFLNKQIAPVLHSLRPHVEYACATGGIIFKPYFDGTGIALDYVHAGNFFPLEFDSRGNIVSAVFIDHKRMGRQEYTRIEQHTRSSGGYVIKNAAYNSYESAIGSPVPLQDIPAWSSLEPETQIAGLDIPLFSYFRIPLGNIIDPSSPLGISVYARAVDLIKEADKQYQRFLWEYEGGELAVHADVNLFRMDKFGRAVLPEGKERLYRALESDRVKEEKPLLDVFAPELRDVSLLNGLNDILMRIEDTCGLARGTFSNPQQEARTATEIKVLKQRSYSTVSDIQKSLQSALDGMLQAMDALADLYNLAPAGKYEASYNWDDSIIVDAETERMQDKEDVRDGILHKWEFRMKWYGEDEATAKRMAPDGMDEDGVMGFADAGTA